MDEASKKDRINASKQERSPKPALLVYFFLSPVAAPSVSCQGSPSSTVSRGLLHIFFSLLDSFPLLPALINWPRLMIPKSLSSSLDSHLSSWPVYASGLLNISTGISKSVLPELNSLHTSPYPPQTYSSFYVSSLSYSPHHLPETWVSTWTPG